MLCYQSLPGASIVDLRGGGRAARLIVAESYQGTSPSFAAGPRNPRSRIALARPARKRQAIVVATGLCSRFAADTLCASHGLAKSPACRIIPLDNVLCLSDNPFIKVAIKC